MWFFFFFLNPIVVWFSAGRKPIPLPLAVYIIKLHGLEPKAGSDVPLFFFVADFQCVFQRALLP